MRSYLSIPFIIVPSFVQFVLLWATFIAFFNFSF